MRRILVMGLCVLYLAFGSVVGQAHVHGSADHHEESRGLHLDHAHVGDHDGQHQDDAPRPPEADGPHADSRHVDHHTGDAVYLSQSALRPLPSVRVLPAIVSASPVIACGLPVSETEDIRPCRPRDPPGKTPPRLRAPPA